MARSSAVIKVTGMKEVRKGLKTFSTDTGWRPALKTAYGTVAGLVAPKAVAKAGASRMGHVARGSIKGKATTTAASIIAYRGVVYGPGFEFGSTGKYRQFPPKKSGGYHIYPAIDEARAEIVNAFGDAIDSELNKQF